MIAALQINVLWIHIGRDPLHILFAPVRHELAKQIPLLHISQHLDLLLVPLPRGHLSVVVIGPGLLAEELSMTETEPAIR